MTDKLKAAVNMFFESYKKITKNSSVASVGLWRSETGSYYWLGSAGMGEVQTTQVSQAFHEAATIMANHSLLLQSNKSVTAPIDVGEPLFQYQRLWCCEPVEQENMCD